MIADEILLKEYERLCTEIRSIEANNEKVIGFGIAIITAGLAYGIDKDLLALFFFVPIGLLGVVFYAILQYRRLFRLGGYKRSLEYKLNEISGQQLLIWEDIVASTSRLNISNRSLGAIYISVILMSSVLSLHKIYHSTPFLVFVVFAVVQIVFFVTAAYALREARRAFENTFQTAKALYK